MKIKTKKSNKLKNKKPKECPQSSYNYF